MNYKSSKTNVINNRSSKVLFFTLNQRLLLGIVINMVGPLIPIISSDLKVGLDYIGIAISVGTFGLLFTALLVGNLTELFGFKKIIFLGMLLIITGCLGLFFSYSYKIFIIAYFILQIGTGTIAVSTMSLVGNHYFENKARSIIKVNIGLTIGAIIAPILVSMISSLRLKWQVMFIYLVISQIALLFFLPFLKIPKKIMPKNNFKSLFSINKNIISTPYFVLCCLMAFLYVSVMQTFFTWFTSYFLTLNIDVNISSILLAIYSVACLIGMIIKNYLIKFAEEKKLLIYSILFSFIFLILVFFIDNLTLKSILILLFGISIAGNFSLTFSMGLNVGPKFTNTASGFLHASAYLGVVIFQFLSGYLSEYFSKNSVLYIDLSLLFFLLIVTLIINKKEI